MPILFKQEDGFLVKHITQHPQFLRTIEALQHYPKEEQYEIIDDNIDCPHLRQYYKEYLLVEELKLKEK